MKRYAILIAILGVISFTSCSNFNTQAGSVGGVSQTPPPAVTAQPTQPSPAEIPSPTMPIFYDFKDVPIPPNFSLIDKESSVLQTSIYKTGVLVFKGRVNYNSVADFYLSAMPRENWKLKGSSRYSHSIMVFEKPGKLCVINIYPKFVYTYLEIYVLPTQSTM